MARSKSVAALTVTALVIACLTPLTGRSEDKVLEGHEGGVRCVSWRPDGKSLASAGHDKTVKVWDVATGKEKAALTGHTSWVISVAWSPDGKTLATASLDKPIKLWAVGP